MAEKLTAGQVANTIAAKYAGQLGASAIDLQNDIARAIRDAERDQTELIDQHKILYDMGLVQVGTYTAEFKAHVGRFAAKPGHILDDAGNVRKVLGALPVTDDGAVVGTGASVFTRRTNRANSAIDELGPIEPPTIDGASDYDCGHYIPEKPWYSTRQAAEGGGKGE